MNDNYFVVLGDVRESRKSNDRNLLQKKLTQTMGIINQTKAYSKVFLAPFSILKGVDEVGAVLKSVTHLYQLISTIENAIYPDIMRFAVNLNRIDVGVMSKDIKMMDGPAFHEASQQLTNMKVKEKLKSRKYFSLDFNEMLPKQIELMYESLVNMVFWIKINWKEDDYKIYKYYKEVDRVSKNKIKNMEELGFILLNNKSQQAISKRFVNHGISLVLDMERNLEDVFNNSFDLVKLNNKIYS
ncbi:MAG: SatD family protein [Caldisericia bacterium]|nr:SatD family protein [Caldisericia bacterium]